MIKFTEILLETIKFRREFAGNYTATTKIFWHDNFYETIIDLYKAEFGNTWAYTMHTTSSPHKETYASGHLNKKSAINDLNNIYKFGLKYNHGSYTMDSERWRNDDPIQK